jgi:uncharacterized protein
VTYLLDVNVLIALFDQGHVHHDAAHRWLGTLAAPTWASCPLTQNGFIRVVSNPAYPKISASPAALVDRLRSFCQQPGHVFWPDAISLTDQTLFDLTKLEGHRQVGDLYLAGLAMHFGGRLATFDSGIPVRALIKSPTELVTIVPTI